ncbi:MAG: MFS transporter [Acidimicrobiales bacterium]
MNLPGSTTANRQIRRAVLASFLLFVVFGLPDGVFGTVWPNLRDHFGRSDGSLGLLVVATSIGYAAGGVSSGPLTERFRVGRVLPAAMTAALVALAMVASAPHWWVLMLGYLVLGVGWGTADAGINAWMALTQGPRAMGLLHASYGVGAFLGPLLATAFVAGGTAWRAPYVMCTALTGVVVLVLLRHRDGFSIATTTPEISAQDRDLIGSIRLQGLMIAWFSVYVGVEIAVGTWAYTLLTEARGYSDAAAGVLTALYWGGLMSGRFVLAVVGHRVRPEQTLRVSTAGAVAAVVVLWADPGGAGGLALPWIGVAFSAMFPVVMGRTAVYLGEARATRAVGLQIAATSVGAISLPALVGVLADRSDVGVAAPVALASTLALGGLWLLIERSVRIDLA